MSNNSKVDILFPVGRLVYGDLYTPNTTDYQGNPLTVKTGANAGQPTSRFEFGVAIPKGPEQHWNQTPWGQAMWNAAAAGFPNGESGRQDFSWKITDGDSQELNRNNKRPCDKEGYPGHWVVGFSTALALKLFTDNGNTQLVNQGEIKPGYFVEVFGNVSPNGNSQNPGLFVNPSLVNRVAFGEEIIGGPDATAVGFGQAGGALPAGASATPIGGNFAPGGQPMQQPAAQPMAQPQAQPMQQPAQPMAQPQMQPQQQAQPMQQPAQPMAQPQMQPQQQAQPMQQPAQAAPGVQPQPNFLNGPQG